MAVKQWETVKYCFCEHVKKEVGFEAEVIYPADHIPDEPRILAHRCSLGFQCNLDGRASCKWAGTNPAYDPFAVSE